MNATTSPILTKEELETPRTAADMLPWRSTPPGSEEFQTVKAIPSWNASNVHWPMVPAEQGAFQAVQQAVMNECGFCMSMSDHAVAGEDGLLNRPGSYVEFDTRKCERGIRLVNESVQVAESRWRSASRVDCV